MTTVELVESERTKQLTQAGKKVREWTERRNQLIREAHEAGDGVREIARAVGLSHPSVLNILERRKR